MDSLGYTALSTFGIVVVNQAVNVFTAWRKEKREDAKASAIAEATLAHTQEQTGKVLEKIEEAKVINLDQINVGNGYNEKILANATQTTALHARMDRVEGALTEIRDMLANLEVR